MTGSDNSQKPSDYSGLSKPDLIDKINRLEKDLEESTGMLRFLSQQG